LETLTCLQELYLSYNGIAKIEGIANCVDLRILDLTNNQVRCVEGIETLTRLEDLWLNENLVERLDEEAFGGIAKTVETVYIENNPCTATDPQYKIKLRRWLPRLRQLDTDILS